MKKFAISLLIGGLIILIIKFVNPNKHTLNVCYNIPLYTYANNIKCEEADKQMILTFTSEYDGKDVIAWYTNALPEADWKQANADFQGFGRYTKDFQLYSTWIQYTSPQKTEGTWMTIHTKNNQGITHSIIEFGGYRSAY